MDKSKEKPRRLPVLTNKTITQVYFIELGLERADMAKTKIQVQTFLCEPANSKQKH